MQLAFVVAAMPTAGRQLLLWSAVEMHYDVQLGSNVQIRPLAVVRRRAGAGQLAKVVPECCGIVWNAIRPLNLKGVGRHVALYLDCEINLEIGVELEVPFAGSGEVTGSSLYRWVRNRRPLWPVRATPSCPPGDPGLLF